MSEISKLETIAKILSVRDGELYLGAQKYPEKGQFVVTGPQGTIDVRKYLGYCVQVRPKQGQFGSHMVFLRHFDGELIVHENQCFWGLTPEQEAMARDIFETLPENEDYTHGYREFGGRDYKIGFVVEANNE